MITLDEIQEQIDLLQAKVDILNEERNDLDWDNAPVICDLNGSQWILGPEAPEELNWADAVAWCKSVGGELPPWDILLHCYVNKEIRDLFTASYYWSSTEFSAAGAWVQHFFSGYQIYVNKTIASIVRAVRRLDI